MTPQTQLTVSQYFNDNEVRGIEQDNDIWFINIDLTKAWGVHRNTINNIIDRNPKKFEGFFTTVAHGTCAGLTAVNEKGLYLLMGAMNTDRMKNQEAAARMLQFQRWIPDLIKSFRKGEVVPAIAAPKTKQSTLDILNEHLDMADSIIKRTGMQKETAHAYAIVMAGDKAGMDLQPYATYLTAQSKQLPLTDGCKPDDQCDFDSHFSLKYISNILKLSEDKTRNILESKNILCYANKRWHLTTYGERYGKVFKVQIGYPYRNIQETWIRYNPELIKELRKEYHIETKVE